MEARYRGALGSRPGIVGKYVVMPPNWASSRGSARTLIGRDAERSQLSSLLEALRRGESRSLVISGEAGVGKTALLEYLTQQAADCSAINVTAVQSEMELPFAALHQLCAPILDELERLPAPQRDALHITFGLHEGPVPDRFLVGLAVLGLLAEAAEQRPLVALVDDEQWLDRATAQILAFVARRLGRESVGLVFSARVPTDELTGLTELVIEGLKGHDAQALLERVLTGPVDSQVREEILAESGGNPLALLELPRGLTPGQLAGGFGFPGAFALTGTIEETFQRRVSALPADARRLLLLAAAEPLGNPLLVWQASDRLGIDRAAGNPAVDADLVDFGARVRFRHPLVRSAIYHSASAQERQEAHRALADATDVMSDPDRRAWHRAQATPSLDEDVADELERSADRGQARGGFAAASAFLERAAVLTPDPTKRTARALAAAQAKVQAGAFDAGNELLTMAETGPLDEFERARADLLRGQIALASSASSEAAALLLKAAKRLEPLDIALARETYLEAWAAALVAGRAAPAGTLHDVCRTARSAPQPASAPRPSDMLLDGLAVVVTEGRAAAASQLRRAASVFAEREVAIAEGLRLGWLATVAAVMLWDEENWHAVNEKQLQSVRDLGLLDHLPVYLISSGQNATWRGDFATAASLIAEADTIAEATGHHFARYAAAMLAAFRGKEAEASALIEVEVRNAAATGQVVAVQWCQLVSAVLYSSLGRYEEALAEAQRASEEAPELYVSAWALPELIEAATRTGNTRLAVEALERLADATSAGESDWGLGILARSRALLSEGEDAEGSYCEAIDRLCRTQLRPELARAQLLFGEWLRRERRRGDAREHLRSAHAMFDEMGMQAFAERARRELRATGETARKRSVETRSELTDQEAQVAKLARDGLSNPEIGAHLFISTRTVQYHLSKVFAKLNITSRTQLERVLR